MLRILCGSIFVAVVVGFTTSAVGPAKAASTASFVEMDAVTFTVERADLPVSHVEADPLVIVAAR